MVALGSVLVLVLISDLVVLASVSVSVLVLGNRRGITLYVWLVAIILPNDF